MSSDLPLLLHVTPQLGALPASDPESIYYAALLQLGAPGRWTLKDADWNANGGRIPYITHLDHHIRPHHLSSLPAFSDPDAELSSEDAAECSAWTAYIEQNLTDLVNHTLYSLPPNYPVLAKAQMAGLTFPTSQYIPQRLRGVIKSRLDHVGLWGMGGISQGDAAAEDQQRIEETFITGPGGTMAPRAWSGWRAGREVAARKRKFGEEELIKRARGVFDPLARRLRDQSYFFGSSPSSVDLKLYAHLALLLSPVLPNPLLANLLRSTYPALTQHHDRLSHLLFPSADPSDLWSSIPRLPRTEARTWSESLSSLLPTGWQGTPSTAKPESGKRKAKSKKEKEFERARWLWFAGAGLGMVTYLFASGIVSIQFGSDDDDENEEDTDDEDGDEEDNEEEVIVLEVDEDDED